jgi:cell division protein FtsW (lipid II flippase)
MKHLATGLIFGAAAVGITYAAGASWLLTVVVGCSVAALVCALLDRL